MRVTIDGVDYEPVGDQRPAIGVGITVHNRNDIAAKAIAEWRRHLPADAVLIVVDDGSTTPLPGADHRFPTAVGVARAKNKCIELLMAAGVQHLFLSDDDFWPAAEDWWRPYVESPEPHLLYIFELENRRRMEQPLRVVHPVPPGVLLYVERCVVDRVGGMRPEFDTWGSEHVEWSARIHNAGFTTARCQDVPGSARLWYSMDQHRREHPGFKSSVSPAAQKQVDSKNRQLLAAMQHTDDYVEYREPVDVVLTSLLTSTGDPQRRRPMAATADMLTAWSSSIRGGRPMVFADQLTEPPAGAVLVAVPAADRNPYWVRWVHAWRWLRDHPEVRWCWITDGTDVEMLSEPWPHMRPGTLYLGSEHSIVGCDWLRQAADPAVKALIATHPDRQLLNAGLCGGSRQVVLDFVRELLDVWWETPDQGPVNDMGALNLVGYRWIDTGRALVGPRINTVFKGQGPDGSASWWKHK